MHLGSPQDSLCGHLGLSGRGIAQKPLVSLSDSGNGVDGLQEIWARLIHERGAQGPPGVPTLYVYLRDLKLAVRNR